MIDLGALYRDQGHTSERRRSVRFVVIALVFLILAACDSAPAPRPHGLVDGAASNDDGGSEIEPQRRGFAVVSSDYASTSISLLAADGTVEVRDFIDSGSASTGLVTALSGDLVLPTRGEDHGVLVLIDRFRTDVVTRIDLGTGQILGQLKTQAPNAQASHAYSSNPRDYVYVDRQGAWVSRYEPNLNPSSGDPDLGPDLLEVDPARFERTGRRIGFSAWNTQVERSNPDSGAHESVAVYARPSNMVRLSKYLVVGIDMFSVAFDAIADSMVALVDLDDLSVTMTTLPGLQSCGDLEPVPDDAKRVVLGCTGFYRGVPRETAGIVVLALDDGKLSVEHAFRTKDEPSSALSVRNVQPIDATHVVASTAGASVADAPGGKQVSPQVPDALYLVDLETGAQAKLLDADDPYALGRPAYDPRSGLLLVPDASIDRAGRPTAGVHRLQRRDGLAFHEMTAAKLDAVLPPRDVRRIE